jgi:hypothetical protein
MRVVWKALVRTRGEEARWRWKRSELIGAQRSNKQWYVRRLADFSAPVISHWPDRKVDICFLASAVQRTTDNTCIDWLPRLVCDCVLHHAAVKAQTSKILFRASVAFEAFGLKRELGTRKKSPMHEHSS